MHILFVDDEPEILAGLKRMLRDYRNSWDIEFAKSGFEALEKISNNSYDVLVTDICMAKMDGVELLKHAVERSPDTIRIVLSGQIDEKRVLQITTLAHQYISKPCDVEKLKSVIARSCMLKNILRDDSLKRLVSQTKTLPSLPHVYTKLLEELQSEHASMHVVAELISQDIGMTAKLMQMVNSSFFGIPRQIESPQHAAVLLGLNVLKPLVLSAGIFSQFHADGFGGHSMEVLVQRSLAVSHLAGEIAKTYTDDKIQIENSMLGGLMHDVGQLLLLNNLKEEYVQVLCMANNDEIPLHKIELARFGSTHAEVGAYLLSTWGLPDPVVEAVAFHHHPLRNRVIGLTPLTAVHAANALEYELQATDGYTYDHAISTKYLDQLGMMDKLPMWRDIASNHYMEEAQLS